MRAFPSFRLSPSVHFLTLSLRCEQGRRQVKKCGVDTHGERAEQEPIMESGVEPPAGSRGRAPGNGLEGKAP